MKSDIIQRLMEEMDADPWHKKLRRWVRLQIWIYTCRTRWIWDKEYKQYLKSKKK